MKSGYSRHIDKLLTRSIDRAKALFSFKGNHYLNGNEWIESVIGKTANPVIDFNIFCLANNINCVFCNRFNILIFNVAKLGNVKSHNIVSIKLCKNRIDSS